MLGPAHRRGGRVVRTCKGSCGQKLTRSRPTPSRVQCTGIASRSRHPALSARGVVPARAAIGGPGSRKDFRTVVGSVTDLDDSARTRGAGRAALRPTGSPASPSGRKCRSPCSAPPAEIIAQARRKSHVEHRIPCGCGLAVDLAHLARSRRRCRSGTARKTTRPMASIERNARSPGPLLLVEPRRDRGGQRAQRSRREATPAGAGPENLRNGQHTLW